MALVNASHAAFSAVMRQASDVLRNGEARYGVTIEEIFEGDGGRRKVIGYLLSLLKIGAGVEVCRKIKIGSRDSIPEMVRECADIARFDGIPVFFLVFQEDAAFRSKWVLVDPKTLAPRTFVDCVVEAAFNATV